jgi:hypothetical protein
MLHSSRDDSSGNNNFQKGTRQTAAITALDPGSSLKLFAYDAFKVCDSKLCVDRLTPLPLRMLCACLV